MQFVQFSQSQKKLIIEDATKDVYNENIYNYNKKQVIINLYKAIVILPASICVSTMSAMTAICYI